VVEDIEEPGVPTCLYPKRIPTAATCDSHGNVERFEVMQQTLHTGHQSNESHFATTLKFLLVLKLRHAEGQIEGVYDESSLLGIWLSHAPHLQIEAIRVTIGIQNPLNGFRSQTLAVYQQTIEFENAMGNWLKRALPRTRLFRRHFGSLEF